MKAEEMLKRLRQRIAEHLVTHNLTIDRLLKDEEYGSLSYHAGGKDACEYLRYYLDYLENGEE